MVKKEIVVALEINSIFYSKQNIDLAYNLKKACRELGISVIYAFQIPELVRYINEIKAGIIFIDCTTIKVTENMISFIKAYSNSHDSIIILVKEKDCCPTTLPESDFIINTCSLLDDLRQIENAILTKLSKQSSVQINTDEINSFVSNYLINIGVMPKHKGFTYIKQAIELAVKHGGIPSLSKDIYPTIASKNKTFSQNVERNIRNAIECACKSNEIKKDNVYLLMSNNKISNRAFLCYLYDLVLNSINKLTNKTTA